MGQKFFSRAKLPMTLNVALGTWAERSDPGLTLAYFTARSKLNPYVFIWGKTGRCSISWEKILQQIMFI